MSDIPKGREWDRKGSIRPVEFEAAGYLPNDRDRPVWVRGYWFIGKTQRHTAYWMYLGTEVHVMQRLQEGEDTDVAAIDHIYPSGYPDDYYRARCIDVLTDRHPDAVVRNRPQEKADQADGNSNGDQP